MVSLSSTPTVQHWQALRFTASWRIEAPRITHATGHINNVPTTDMVDVSSIDNLFAGAADSGGKAFTIQRFDRTADGNSIYIKYFAQVLDVYPWAKCDKASYRNLARGALPRPPRPVSW